MGTAINSRRGMGELWGHGGRCDPGPPVTWLGTHRGPATRWPLSTAERCLPVASSSVAHACCCSAHPGRPSCFQLLGWGGVAHIHIPPATGVPAL
eukprot:scaffold3096_cov403-Prasinococcus_capsulatus_cf.AAC.16